MRYAKVKKLMENLDNMSDNFDSIIVTQDQITENSPLIPSSSNQNNNIVDNSTIVTNPRWKFIQEKDLHVEEKKLLKHIIK